MAAILNLNSQANIARHIAGFNKNRPDPRPIMQLPVVATTCPGNADRPTCLEVNWKGQKGYKKLVKLYKAYKAYKNNQTYQDLMQVNADWRTGHDVEFQMLWMEENEPAVYLDRIASGYDDENDPHGPHSPCRMKLGRIAEYYAYKMAGKIVNPELAARPNLVQDIIRSYDAAVEAGFVIE